MEANLQKLKPGSYTYINQLGSYVGLLHKRPIKPNILDTIPGYQEDVDLDKQITEEEFRNILKGLNTNKAPGCDDIPAMDLIPYSFAPLILFRVPYMLDLLLYYLSIANGAGGIGILNFSYFNVLYRSYRVYNKAIDVYYTF